MSKKLTPKEIYDRMQQLRNLEKLHAAAIASNKSLKKEMKFLKEQVKEIPLLKQQVEELQLIIEELRQIIFGKKKKDEDDNNPFSGSQKKKKEKKKRSKDSYRRPTPGKEEITQEIEHHLECCPECEGSLLDRDISIRYVEDMACLAMLHQILKRVEKHSVETGYCGQCKKRVSAIPLSKQTVALGENVKQYVTYLSTVRKLSYKDVQEMVTDMCHIHISSGEISNILEQSSITLGPEHERLKIKIRGRPGIQMDETPWKVQKEGEGNYAWVMTGTDTTDAVFDLGRSRGKKVAEELIGTSKAAGVTDSYPVYDNIFEDHQRCWSHPHRKLRDLAKSSTLAETRKEYCRETYGVFSKMYEDVRTICKEQFDLKKREKQHRNIMRRIQRFTNPHPDDPKKLSNIKKELRRHKKDYGLCILREGIPSDNNKAERALRHLVLKRKGCFGSKTKKGAEIMSVLYSVILSQYWKKPDNFFKEYTALFKTA